jgi:acyl-coenzyme A synthetase/AMP-(fatty) acid ligase
VEAVINRHPSVRMSLVTGRKNPIMGTIVAAEVVLTSGDGALDPGVVETTKSEILAACRSSLAAHKVPASIRFTSSLAVTASGKLGRRNA